MPTRVAMSEGAQSIVSGFAGAILGAVLGALCGYWFARYQQGEERKAARESLIDLLRRELGRIGPPPGPYDISKAFYRDPIWLSAPIKLLEPGVLEFRKESQLIELLLNLKVALDRYNDFVGVANLAQAGTIVPDEIHASWYETMKTHHAAIIAVKEELISRLGSSSDVKAA